MKKLIVKLKQHTPLIHFQGDQLGATLRSSDVKPRFDRWLIENEFNGIENFSTYSQYIQPVLKKELKEKPSLHDLQKGKLAFDYSLRISLEQPMDFETISRDQPANTYFGNMGGGDNKFLVFPADLNSESDIKLTFKGAAAIIELISKHIGNFFWSNNFMTRSSKGYGCFSVEAINGEPVQKEYPYNLKFSVRVPDGKTGVNIYCDKGGRNESMNSIFNAIDLFYRSIRSGINLKDRNDNTAFYFKSCLFRYLHSQGIQWDKKTLKASFLNDANKNSFINNRGEKEIVSFLSHQGSRHAQEGEVPDILDGAIPAESNNSFEDFRDRLGLSSIEKYKSYNGKVEKSIAGKARIPSPILIKPHYSGTNEFTIYVLINDLVEKQMPYGENVEIKYKQFELEKARTKIPRSINLPLAKKSSFELAKYLNWVINESGNISRSIEENGPKGEGIILRDVYNQISQLNQNK